MNLAAVHAAKYTACLGIVLMYHGAELNIVAINLLVTTIKITGVGALRCAEDGARVLRIF